jgi:hypothetical protein
MIQRLSDWRWINLNKLHELLQKIKARPELYLGKKSLERLHPFLSGYVVCLSDRFGESCPVLFSDFQEYVQKKYQITSSHSCEKIIDFYSRSDEEAFDKYFDLMNEFLKKSEESCCRSK